MALISQAEWARRNGFSRQYAHELVKKGTVALEDGKINEETANVILASIRDLTREPKVNGNSTNGHSKKNGVANVVVGCETQLEASELSKKLLVTRIKNEQEKGKLLEAKAKTEIGQLIDAEEVKKAAFDKARIVRDSLLNIPDRIASLLTSITDETEMHEILTKEIRLALESLTNE